MDIRKTMAVIFIALGIVMLAVPFCYRFEGKKGEEKLMQQFEYAVGENQNGESEKTDETNEDGKTSGNEEAKTIFTEGEAIAVLEIPSLGIRYPVVEGCSMENLKYAIGHMSETVEIGSVGNCVLAGHNGSRHGEYFTHLDEIKSGDEVTLLNSAGETFCYVVEKFFIVGAYDNSIKESVDRTELTLFTCAEHGTKRFVVKCSLAE